MFVNFKHKRKVSCLHQLRFANIITHLYAETVWQSCAHDQRWRYPSSHTVASEPWPFVILSRAGQRVETQVTCQGDKHLVKSNMSHWNYKNIIYGMTGSHRGSSRIWHQAIRYLSTRPQTIMPQKTVTLNILTFKHYKTMPLILSEII